MVIRRASPGRRGVGHDAADIARVRERRLRQLQRSRQLGLSRVDRVDSAMRAE